MSVRNGQLAIASHAHVAVANVVSRVTPVTVGMPTTRQRKLSPPSGPSQYEGYRIGLASACV